MTGVLEVSLFSTRRKTRSRNQTKWIHNSEEQEVFFSISDVNIRNQFHALGLSLEEMKVAKTIYNLIKTHSHSISYEFYQSMCHIPEYKKIVNESSSSERWIQMHAAFLVSMFDGHF